MNPGLDKAVAKGAEAKVLDLTGTTRSELRQYVPGKAMSQFMAATLNRSVTSGPSTQPDQMTSSVLAVPVQPQLPMATVEPVDLASDDGPGDELDMVIIMLAGTPYYYTILVVGPGVPV